MIQTVSDWNKMRFHFGGARAATILNKNIDEYKLLQRQMCDVAFIPCERYY